MSFQMNPVRDLISRATSTMTRVLKAAIVPWLVVKGNTSTCRSGKCSSVRNVIWQVGMIRVLVFCTVRKIPTVMHMVKAGTISVGLTLKIFI